MAKHQKITPTEARFPLAKLTLSAMNPRQFVPQTEVEELAESIWAAGLIQSIAGLADDEGGVEIVAGGRRLRALQHLAEKHSDLAKLRPDLANPLVMLAPDAATAQSWGNLENVVRRDLHPAEEIRAYGKMAEDGATPASIARSFAVTEKHVYRRLALATLPAPILDALAANDISLSMAACFTICDDTDHALEILAQCRGSAWSDYNLKAALKPAAIKATDRRAVFVGLEAYKEAGGGVTCDLFAENTYLEDLALLDRLFNEALEGMKPQVAVRGWKWVEARTEVVHFGWYDVQQEQMTQLSVARGVLTDEQATRYDALAEMLEIGALDEAGQTELDTLQSILDGGYTEDQKAVAGAIIYVTRDGEVRVAEGLILPEDKATARAAGLIARTSESDREEKPKSLISHALAEDLGRVMTGARQHASLSDPDLLLSLLAYELSGEMGHRHAFGIRTDDVPNMPTTGESGYALDARLTTPNYRSTDPWGSDLAEGFEAFRQQGRDHIMAELTRHLAALLTGGDAKLRALIDAEVVTAPRRVWTPTVANMWNRVPGTYRVMVWRDLLDLSDDHPTATSFAKMKKAEQADRLEKLFTDEAFRSALGVSKSQAEKIAHWLPDCMA
jgi:ParB family transcriptional regulator, chromosome partitioning protein